MTTALAADALLCTGIPLVLNHQMSERRAKNRIVFERTYGRCALIPLDFFVSAAKADTDGISY